MGRVEAICVSVRKGEKKSPQRLARFIANHGIEGDAHAGSWHRQVSLLAAEDINTMRRRALPGLESGDFAENLVVSGLDLGSLGLGSRLQLAGEADLAVTQLGKACHRRCAIYYQTGDCIMPRLGLFARVLRGGTVSTGDNVEVLQTVPRKKLQAVILTVSNPGAGGDPQDAPVPAAGRLLENHLQAHIYASEIIPNEPERIAARLRHYSNWHSVDFVLVVGGATLILPDVLPESDASVMPFQVPAPDSALRCTPRATRPAAMFTGALPVVRNRTLIAILPGSERDPVAGLLDYLPVFARGLAELRGDLFHHNPARGESAA